MEMRAPDWFENWHKGIPEWDEIQHGINVKDILRLWTWAKAIDLVKFGSWRYNMIGEMSHWVPGHRVQDFDEKALLQAVADNPFAEKIHRSRHPR